MISFEFDPSPSLRMVKLVGTAHVAMPKAVDYASLRVTTELQNAIVKRLRSGRGLKPLAESTIKMKRSSKPLIHHGDMLSSIKYQLVAGKPGTGTTGYFVGVHRSAKGRSGQALANIAEIHEFGTSPYSITVTGRMRGFWWAMFRKKIFASPLRKDTTAIRHPGLPERSFLRKPYQSWFTGSGWDLAGSVQGRGAQERWMTYIEQQLGLNKGGGGGGGGGEGGGGSGGASRMGALFAKLGGG